MSYGMTLMKKFLNLKSYRYLRKSSKFFSAAYKKTGNSLQFNLKIQKDQGINLLATIFIELEL